MRNLLIVLSMLFLPTNATHAEVNVGIGINVPGLSIGINMPMYPRLIRVPGYPVYYDPRVDLNYFFYDGLYWVFQGEDWYASGWYNGPWELVERDYVPLYVLRVPVRYYRRPPPYFRGWHDDEPPHWGDHWGHDWEHRRSGWDKWDRRSAPRPAPLPSYQRRFTGDSYPRLPEVQHSIRSKKYQYQPHEPVTQEHYQNRHHRDESHDKGRKYKGREGKDGKHEGREDKHRGRGRDD